MIEQTAERFQKMREPNGLTMSYISVQFTVAMKRVLHNVTRQLSGSH